MPVILDEEVWGAWLDASTGAEALDALLVPAEDALLAWHEVSVAVNNTRNNDSSLMLELVPRDISSETLF
jgi:putative SOS response-associated peptidase YedK